MTLSLPRKLEKVVEERVASGRYTSAEDVIREALQVLCERDKFEQLRADIRGGLEQLDRLSPPRF